MKAVIELKVHELNEKVVEYIKSLFSGKQDAKLTISVEEPDASYLDTLRRSKDDLELGRNLITFTIEELEVYGDSKK